MLRNLGCTFQIQLPGQRCRGSLGLGIKSVPLKGVRQGATLLRGCTLKGLSARSSSCHVKGWQKRATLGAVFGPPSTTPNPAASTFFKSPRRQACKVSLSLHQTAGHVFDTLPVLSPPRATNFGSSSSVPQNGPLSIYSAGHGWRYI